MLLARCLLEYVLQSVVIPDPFYEEVPLSFVKHASILLYSLFALFFVPIDCLVLIRFDVCVGVDILDFWSCKKKIM